MVGVVWASTVGMEYAPRLELRDDSLDGCPKSGELGVALLVHLAAFALGRPFPRRDHSATSLVAPSPRAEGDLATVAEAWTTGLKTTEGVPTTADTARSRFPIYPDPAARPDHPEGRDAGGLHVVGFLGR